MGKLILVEGTDPDKYYDLTTVNDNIFPFEVKDYKYLHLRTSMDLSGSQAIIKLKEDDPYEMVCRPLPSLQTPIIFRMKMGLTWDLLKIYGILL